MVKRKTKMFLQQKEQELKNNLENNYKDLARDALKEYKMAVEDCHNRGELKEKDYTKYRGKVDEYERKMIGYHH